MDNYKTLVDKVEKVTKGKNLDLSSGEDLSIGIMNLISIEEHLFFSAQKTGKKEYLDLLDEVRKMRVDLLKEIIKDYEGEVWCLPPQTVLFGNPGPKKISEFKEKDKVFTHKGKFQTVQKTFVRDYNGDLISINPYYSDPLMLTPGHEVLCATDVRKKQTTLWRKNFVLPNVVWKKAEEVSDSDFLLFPRYLEEENIDKIKLEYSWINRGCFKPTTFKQESTLLINNDLITLIGIYLAEGSTHESRYLYKNSTKTQATLYFSFGKHETNLIRKTQRLFERAFNIPIKVSETKTTIDLVCSRRIVVKFFKQFGTRSKEKVLSDWLLKLPKEKLYSLLWGLVMGDGMIDKYQISYFTSSEKLAYQLRILLFKLGILHSLKKIVSKGGEISGRKLGPSVGFEITIAGDAARILNNNAGLKYKVKRTSGNFGYVLDDYVMIPIRKVEKVKYSGKVYNLQTEAQTYTTFTGVVHNCISKHLLAASMRLMEVGTKELKKGDKEKANKMFENSYKLYSLFWGLNTKMVNLSEVKRDIKDVYLVDEKAKKFEKVSIFSKLNDFIQKALDCCRE